MSCNVTYKSCANVSSVWKQSAETVGSVSPSPRPAMVDTGLMITDTEYYSMSVVRMSLRGTVKCAPSRFLASSDVPYWGIGDAEIKVPSFENRELSKFSL